MKATSIWVWAPIMLIGGFVISMIMGAKPRDVKLGKFTEQAVAVRTSLDTLAKEAQSAPNASSVTVHFSGPHPLKDDQSEFWSFNRRLNVLIGFVNVEKDGGVKFSKIVCPERNDTKLAELASKPNLTSDPKSCGCFYEDPKDIGGNSSESAAPKTSEPKAPTPAP
jgi:hypothetical protein